MTVGEDIVEELYCRHQAELLVYARAFDPVDPSDLVQDTLVRALRHRTTLADLPAGARRRWLYTTLRNLAVDRFRHGHEEAELQEPDELPGSDQFADRIATGELMDRLEPKLRETVRMRYWLRMNSTEIGHALGVSPATVRYWLAAARRVLRLWAGENGKE
jgi:RNA polymerase sigma-70 factor (ECF subfamily)